MATASYARSDAKLFPPTQTDGLNTEDGQFLLLLGKCVRELREQRGMTRKLLAQQADISERYLGQLESGDGNVSIILLRHIAVALRVPLHELLALDQNTAASQRRQIALIGLRGAGKTTLGNLLAQSLQAPFIELDQEIEQDTGLPLSEIFTLYGQSGYRRIEHRCLERVLAEHERAVLTVGGGIVSEEETFSLLLTRCYTIWLKAQPEEHMARVLAQGDFRPMTGHKEAMEDLKRILAARAPFYSKAHAFVDTSGRTTEESFLALQRIVNSSTPEKEG